MIEPNRQGEVWVFAEQEDGALHDVSLELCGRAAELAARLGVKTGAVLPGHKVEAMARRLIAHGIDTVYADRRSPAGPLPDGFLRPCAQHGDRKASPANRASTGRRPWAATWRRGWHRRSRRA